MKKCWPHKTGFVYPNALALYRKRDCAGNDVLFKGRAEGCGNCGRIRFICDDPRLSVQEVTFDRRMPSAAEVIATLKETLC